MKEVLSISGISKLYGSLLAVNNLSFTVNKGEIYGILGPNGSGKTTTLGIVLGVLNASQGHYKWFGEAPTKKARQKVGSMLETPNFYPYLSAEKNLEISATIKGIDNSSIETVLKDVKLYERKDSKFKTFSLGMKQRLCIAAALLGDPDVLLLDEPTNGLDPQGIAEVRELIFDLAQQGKTIILASHLLSEVEKVCTNVAVLKKGNLLVEGAVDEILVSEPQMVLACENLDVLQEAVESHPDVTKVENKVGHVIATHLPRLKPAEMNKYLFNRNITLTYLTQRKKSLEKHFLELISK